MLKLFEGDYVRFDDDEFGYVSECEIDEDEIIYWVELDSGNPDRFTRGFHVELIRSFEVED